MRLLVLMKQCVSTILLLLHSTYVQFFSECTLNVSAFNRKCIIKNVFAVASGTVLGTGIFCHVYLLLHNQFGTDLFKMLHAAP